MHHEGSQAIDGWQLHRPETEPLGWRRKQFVWSASAHIVVQTAWEYLAPQLSERLGRELSDNNPLDLGYFLEALSAEYLAGLRGGALAPTLARFERRRWR